MTFRQLLAYLVVGFVIGFALGARAAYRDRVTVEIFPPKNGIPNKEIEMPSVYDLGLGKAKVVIRACGSTIEITGLVADLEDKSNDADLTVRLRAALDTACGPHEASN